MAGITYNLTMNLTLEDSAVFEDSIPIIREATVKIGLYSIMFYSKSLDSVIMNWTAGVS